MPTICSYAELGLIGVLTASASALLNGIQIIREDDKDKNACNPREYNFTYARVIAEEKQGFGRRRWRVRLCRLPLSGSFNPRQS